MALIKELFASEFGIMSAVVLFAVLVIMGYIVWLFIKKSSVKPSDE